MKFLRQTGKYIRRFAWAFVVAYMVAWHNVYKEKSDMSNSIAYHMENDHEEDNSDKNIRY